MQRLKNFLMQNMLDVFLLLSPYIFILDILYKLL